MRAVSPVRRGASFRSCVQNQLTRFLIPDNGSTDQVPAVTQLVDDPRARTCMPCERALQERLCKQCSALTA
jgi:hypothetical protein